MMSFHSCSWTHECPKGRLFIQLEIYDQVTIISRGTFILVRHILFIIHLCSVLLSVGLVVSPPSGGNECGD